MGFHLSARVLAQAGLVLLAVTAAVRPAAADPGAAAMAAVRTFVFTDCEVGEEGLALARLLEHGQAVQPELVRMLREGPDEATSVELRATTEAAWERRVAFLSTNPPLGLTPDDLLRAHNVDRETWIETQLEHHVQHFREHAVIGLAAIGSPVAVQALREARRGASHDLRSLIDAALTRLHADKTRTRVRQPRAVGGLKKSARP